MKTIAMLTISLLFFPLMAFAQDGGEPSPPTFDVLTLLASKTSVVVLTLLLVEGIKRHSSESPLLNSIPNWVYAIFIATCLTLLAVLVFETIDGVWWKVAIEVSLNAMLGALAAVGAFSVIKQPLAAPKNAR